MSWNCRRRCWLASWYLTRRITDKGSILIGQLGLSAKETRKPRLATRVFRLISFSKAIKGCRSMWPKRDSWRLNHFSTRKMWSELKIGALWFLKSQISITWRTLTNWPRNQSRDLNSIIMEGKALSNWVKWLRKKLKIWLSPWLWAILHLTNREISKISHSRRHLEWPRFKTISRGSLCHRRISQSTSFQRGLPLYQRLLMTMECRNKNSIWGIWFIKKRAR